MSTYKGPLVTTSPDCYGYRFSSEVLEKLVAEQPKLPVFINFRGEPVGHTEEFELDYENSAVVCRFTVEKKVPFLDESYITGDWSISAFTPEGPAYKQIVRVDNADLTSVNIVLTPTTPSLELIEPVKNEPTDSDV